MCMRAQALASPTRKEVAQKERERLRLQAKAKKELLEKMRADQNKDSSDGDVCHAVWDCGIGRRVTLTPLFPPG